MATDFGWKICRLFITLSQSSNLRETRLRCFSTGLEPAAQAKITRARCSLKVFRGTVTMTSDDKTKPIVKPVMTHFFYMDQKDPSRVRRWFGSVGPIQF